MSKKIKTVDRYLIDGIFDRVEFTILDVQEDKCVSYNRQKYDVDTQEIIECEEFVEGLPLGLDLDSYFKLALLREIQALKQSILIKTKEFKWDNDREINSLIDEHINNSLNSSKQQIAK